MQVQVDTMRRAAEDSYVLATDLADYLVSKGMPFREAHGVMAKLSKHAENQRKLFSELALKEYQQFSKLFADDVYDITVESSLSARDVSGGTAPSQVEKALANARNLMKA